MIKGYRILGFRLRTPAGEKMFEEIRLQSDVSCADVLEQRAGLARGRRVEDEVRQHHPGPASR